MWPYAKSLDATPAPRTQIRTDDGRPYKGLNFASQDYLGLTTHPAVREAGIAAIRDFGPHSAGSPVLLGNTSESLRLEDELAAMLQMQEVVLYPTGWAAGFGAITGLVCRDDHVVLDQLAHQCLQQGARAATAHVHHFDHLDNDALEASLQSIRAGDSENGILVVTESLYSMDADVPDLERTQALCNEYNATLMVDVAHDLGAMGPGGTGALGTQDMLGQVDLVMGSFSKTFASNGGFVAVGRQSAKQYLKYYSGTHAFSNALSPVQCAIVRAALQVVCSDEGAERRAHLMTVVHTLRRQLEDQGIPCAGVPSPIVPAQIDDVAVAWRASRRMAEQGVLTNLAEYPAVAPGTARFRLQAMATHTTEDARTAATLISAALEEAREQVHAVAP